MKISKKIFSIITVPCIIAAANSPISMAADMNISELINSKMDEQ